MHARPDQPTAHMYFLMSCVARPSYTAANKCAWTRFSPFMSGTKPLGGSDAAASLSFSSSVSRTPKRLRSVFVPG